VVDDGVGCGLAREGPRGGGPSLIGRPELLRRIGHADRQKDIATGRIGTARSIEGLDRGAMSQSGQNVGRRHLIGPMGVKAALELVEIQSGAKIVDGNEAGNGAGR